MPSAWEPLSNEKIFASIRLRSREEKCVVVIEPVGSEYQLDENDMVLIEIMSPSMRPEDTDVEIVHVPVG